MFTKKQTKDFKKKLDEGIFPRIPKIFIDILKMNSSEIKNNIQHAKNWSYKYKIETLTKRLIQIGIFDENYNFTEKGIYYKNEMCKLQ